MQNMFPNNVGAVAVLWGARLIPEIATSQPVTKEQTALPDLFLDVVVYAKNQMQSHSTQAKELIKSFSYSGPNSILGFPAIETISSVLQHPVAMVTVPIVMSDSRVVWIVSAVTGLETVSRCFCNDTWNMDCFEMSFEETRFHENQCPTKYKKSVS